MGLDQDVSPTRVPEPVRKGSDSSASDSSQTQPPSPRSTSSIEKDGFEKTDSGYLYDVKSVGPLAPSDAVVPTPGRALLVAIGLIKGERTVDLDAVATRESVFDGPLATYYKPHPKWENNGAFDPSLRWTYREERTARRKVDYKVFLWTLVMFLALNIDRGNISNATADNLLKDLRITQADYNLGNTLWRVGFLAAELPSQMVGKKIGVDIWLPAQICIFSILSFAQAWMNGRTSFLLFRFFIAFFQGGFIPDTILYLSYYYTKHELPVRLAFFWCCNYFAGIVTGFLGAGFIEMRGVNGWAGWQWLFCIEGLLTLVVGIASFFVMAPSPSQTKRKWRPKGFFTDREVGILVNRVIRDDPGKSSMHNRQALTPKLLWEGLKDYDLWPLYAIGLLFGIPGYPLSNYFQISMKGLGFSTLMSNILSVPNVVISMFNLLFITILSELVNNRTAVCMLEDVWFLPFYIALVLLPSPVKPWTWFAIATLLLGFPYSHAIQVAWVSRNSSTVRTRTVSSAIYNMMVQISGIIGANAYQASDAPRYYKANKGLIGLICFNLVILYPGTYLYYRARNKSKSKIWDAMSNEQKSEYLATTTDDDGKRLDFRFAN